MRPLSFALLCFGWYSVSCFGQIAPRPVPPSDTTVPVGARLELQVIGEGIQVYTCSRKNGPLAWTFAAPDAKLLDPATHATLGRHSAGPTWRWNDGSAVTGRVVVSQPSTEAGSIPWLLLAASPVGNQKGQLSGIVWVRRSETHGGAIAAGSCVATEEGRSVNIPYHALYTFYSVGSTTAQ